MTKLHLPTLVCLHCILIINAQFTDADWEKHEEDTRFCMAHAKIDQESLGKVFDRDKARKTENFKCYIKCMNQKNGVLDENLYVNVKAIRHDLISRFKPASEAEAIIEKCNQFGSLCDIAEKKVECLTDEIRKAKTFYEKQDDNKK